MQINEFHISKTRIHDDNHKNVFFPSVLELNNLLEKISRNSRAYFQFSKKSFEIWSEVLFKGSLRSKERVN